ncbi:uncharacterized protein PAC_16698 [Phialocephala subalpina]|uniref:Heterokaryon incompatibility domain-containing protein n=1 Tax=Phialocephala subalpina TaxID=576137 RepID=A0A1L7XP98_9HELO|nr:uncharacterized protein PAC_16698 [Phialocephala subalpina]
MENQMAENLQETAIAIAADESSPRIGGYFSEAIHQGVVDHHQRIQVPATRREDRIIFTFSISSEIPKGLGGNFDGWKSSSVFSASSEISQWLTARNGGVSAEEGDEPEPHSELKMITLTQGKYILRQLITGKFVAYRQLSIDRQPSEELIGRRHDWNAAIQERSRKRNNVDQAQRQTVAHSCSFCTASSEETRGPTWLFDRVQGRTVSVANEFPDGTPPYEVLSYTWGRAASNAWEEVPGVPWNVRSSTGLPISRILEALALFSGTYVWVDIFCIPQDCPSAKAREIARQAQIFRGATGGIAWLHQTSAVWPLQDSHPPIPPPLGTFAAIEELISDPWFSSTWALQEAILRPNMYMIGSSEWRSALFFPHGTLDRAAYGDKPMALDDFRGYLSILRAVASSAVKVGIQRFNLVRASNTLMRPHDALRLEMLFQDTGLSGLITPTPATILSSLSVRTSVKPHDQFYGVQAVFNLAMQGDYERPLDSVRGEFLGYVWSEYAPILALALNRPVVKSRSTSFLSDTEDSLLWFSYAQLKEGRLSCVPPGSSSVTVTFNTDSFSTFVAAESSADNPWHYEATSSPPAHSKNFLIRYGLPPLPIDTRPGPLIDLYEPEVPDRKHWWNRLPLFRTITRWWRAWRDCTGKAGSLSRTTRLMYVGRFINETGHKGLRRDPYVYIEYYLTASGVGHRVGAVLSDLPFGYRKVDGLVVFS